MGLSQVDSDDILKKQIGAAIQELREARSLTRLEMACKLDLHLSTYQSWERGRHLIPLSRFIDVCEVLGVRASDMLETALRAVELRKARMALVSKEG